MMHPDRDYPEEKVPMKARTGSRDFDKSSVSYRTPHGSSMDKESQRIQCFKYMLFAYNLLIFICGAVLLGIGIWMAVDRNFITYMVGTDLYAVAIFMLLAGGAIIFAISFLGCCGSITENRCMLFTFFIVLCVMFLTLLIGGILAGAFRAQIGDAVQDTMTDTLVNHYGVELQYRRNRLITDAWDKAQERLQCCAVSTEGWSLYRESEWFKRFGAYYEIAGVSNTDEDQKPYVPRSCCVKDRFWRLINAEVCQKWRLGPPGSPDDGAMNRALYYNGCYDEALHYIKENSSILIGLGISIAILLVGGIVLAFMMVRMLKPSEED